MSKQLTIWKNFKMERILFEWIIRKNNKLEQIYIGKRISNGQNLKMERISNEMNFYWNKY
jgi:hypothetical protein